MAGKLEGKVAVITGGSSGIGLATAERFVLEGAHVYITGRDQADLDRAAEKIGKQATAVQGDVSKLPDVERLYDQVKREKGKVDVIFANAAKADMCPLEEVTEAYVDQVFGANVRGLFFTVQKALPILVDGGAVVLNASIAAQSGFAGLGIYSASKAAVRSLARSMSTELKGRKVRVNSVSPGVIPTPGYGELGMSPDEVDAFVKGMTDPIPIARGGTADEVARAVLFLASEDSSYVTGIDLVVDGGLTQV